MKNSNSHIRNIKDLAAHNADLRNEIRAGEIRIGESLQAAVLEIPQRVTESLSKNSLERNLDKLSDPAGKLLPELSSILLKKTVLRKVGFFKRLLISAAAKLVVKKVLKPYASHPVSLTDNPDYIYVPARKIELQKDSSSGPPEKNIPAVANGKEKLSFKGLWRILKASFAGFGDHKVTKISGSLAYYTVFSMGPLLVVIISLCGIFMKKEAARGKVFAELKGFLGTETAMQLQEIIKSAGLGDKGTIAFIIGLITLLLGATSVFGDIQDSINTIWGIKPKPKRGWLKMLQNRFLSFSVIISLGFLLLVSLGVTAVLDGFSGRLQARFADISVIFFYILNTLVTLGVVSAIFGVIFKVLPDADIKWRDVTAGAVVTGILFIIGKMGISLYISQSNVGSTYGAAGSLVVLLLWTYYSSIILYFGAEFTKSYAVAYGAEILPNPYAVTVKEVEVEQGSSSVQETKAKSDVKKSLK